MRRMLCSAAAAVFAVCAIPSVCAYAARADACQEARVHDKRVGAQVTDPRVLRAITAVVEVSGFRPHVVACEVSMPYLSATVGNLGSYYYWALRGCSSHALPMLNSVRRSGMK